MKTIKINFEYNAFPVWIYDENAKKEFQERIEQAKEKLNNLLTSDYVLSDFDLEV